MTSMNAIVENPVFTGEAGEIATRQFGATAADLSKCLHQVCSYVMSKSLGLTKYALKFNESMCHEEVAAEVSNGKLVVSLKQEACVDVGFSDVSMLDDYIFIDAFDAFVRKHVKADLKSVAQYYRVFLMSVTSGLIYGKIEEEGNVLKLHIGKYDKDFKPIHVLVKLELS